MEIQSFSLFAESDRMELLSKLGDPLERLAKLDWEMFRPTLTKVLRKEAKGVGGRPPYDYILMFKTLVIKRLYNLSDEQTEFQINDRISFMRFLGLSLSDKVPDAKTIWFFENSLKEANRADEKLFDKFLKFLEKQGVITHKGTIVDATFVDAPKQRNHRDENKTIKEGGIPKAWQEDNPKAKHKLAQKDTDARWTKKGNETHYGYKDHAKVDADSKLITNYEVTSASVHDSQCLVAMLDKNDNAIYADSAYAGEPIAEKLPKHIENQIHEKGYRNHPLTEEQKARNNQKSKIRARIEHVFGYMTNTMHGITVRCIGIAKAKLEIGLMNLVYNISRYLFLIKPKKRRPAMG